MDSGPCCLLVKIVKLWLSSGITFTVLTVSDSYHLATLLSEQCIALFSEKALVLLRSNQESLQTDYAINHVFFSVSKKMYKFKTSSLRSREIFVAIICFHTIISSFSN